MEQKTERPRLCTFFIQTDRGVIVQKVVMDFRHQGKRKKKAIDYWTSWRDLTADEHARFVTGLDWEAIRGPRLVFQ